MPPVWLAEETEPKKRAEDVETLRKAAEISEAARKASEEETALKRATEEADAQRKATEEEAEAPRVAEANRSEEANHQAVGLQEYERKLLKRRKKEAAKDQTQPRAKKLRITGFSCSICPPPSTDLVANQSKYSTEEALHGHMAESHFLQWILKQHPIEEGSTVCRLMLSTSYFSSEYFLMLFLQLSGLQRKTWSWPSCKSTTPWNTSQVFSQDFSFS